MLCDLEFPNQCQPLIPTGVICSSIFQWGIVHLSCWIESFKELQEIVRTKSYFLLSHSAQWCISKKYFVLATSLIPVDIQSLSHFMICRHTALKYSVGSYGVRTELSLSGLAAHITSILSRTEYSSTVDRRHGYLWCVRLGFFQPFTVQINCSMVI